MYFGNWAIVLLSLSTRYGNSMRQKIWQQVKEKSETESDIAYADHPPWTEYPWAVWLTAQVDVPGRPLVQGQKTCSGTVQGEWVLTAAHCFQNPPYKDLSKWRLHFSDGLSEQPIEVHVHDKLDIAAVKCATPRPAHPVEVTLDPRLTPSEPGDVLELVGFGQEEDPPRPSGRLGRATFTAQTCIDQSLITPGIDVVGEMKEPDEFCAWTGPESKVSSCKGDSGGPWFRRQSGGAISVVGVNSMGFGGTGGCGSEHKMGKFHAVSHSRDFIDTTTSGTFLWNDSPQPLVRQRPPVHPQPVQVHGSVNTFQPEPPQLSHGNSQPAQMHGKNNGLQPTAVMQQCHPGMRRRSNGECVCLPNHIPSTYGCAPCPPNYVPDQSTGQWACVNTLQPTAVLQPCHPGMRRRSTGDCVCLPNHIPATYGCAPCPPNHVPNFSTGQWACVLLQH